VSAWTKAWTRATWGPAARRATPVWAGVAIVGTVVFAGPNGMKPRDVTDAVLGGAGVGAAVIAAWLLLIAPVGRALVRAPGTEYLRSLPAPRGARWAIAAAGAVVAQLPWLVLWTAGAGRVAGVVAMLGAAAVTVAVGAVPVVARRSRVPVWRARWRAAAGVHLRGVARVAGASVVRGVGFALLAGALGGALVDRNALVGGDAVVYAGAIAAVLIAIGLAGSIAAVAASELRLEWLARSTGLGAARAGATMVVLAAVGGGLGAVAGAIAAVIAGSAAALEVAAATVAIGVGMGLAGTRIATWARRVSDGVEVVDGTRVVVGIAAIGFVAVAALGAFGAVGLVAIVGGGLGMAAMNADAIVKAERVER
jgi:hypothetical protein